MTNLEWGKYNDYKKNTIKKLNHLYEYCNSIKNMNLTKDNISLWYHTIISDLTNLKTTCYFSITQLLSETIIDIIESYDQIDNDFDIDILVNVFQFKIYNLIRKIKSFDKKDSSKRSYSLYKELFDRASDSFINHEFRCADCTFRFTGMMNPYTRKTMCICGLDCVMFFNKQEIFTPTRVDLSSPLYEPIGVIPTKLSSDSTVDINKCIAFKSNDDMFITWLNNQSTGYREWILKEISDDCISNPIFLIDKNESVKIKFDGEIHSYPLLKIISLDYMELIRSK